MKNVWPTQAARKNRMATRGCCRREPSQSRKMHENMSYSRLDGLRLRGSGRVAGHALFCQGIEKLVDAERLVQDGVQAFLPRLDERMGGIVAVGGHEYDARLGLGLA